VNNKKEEEEKTKNSFYTQSMEKAASKSALFTFLFCVSFALQCRFDVLSSLFQLLSCAKTTHASGGQTAPIARPASSSRANFIHKCAMRA
jgi:hypothetical protein